MKKHVLIASLISCLASLSSAQAATKLEPGSVVVFSNGLVEKLIKQESDSSVWETARKRMYERASTGFFENRREERYPPGSRTTVWDVNEEELQTLMNMAPGSKLDFDAYRTRNGVTEARIWTCSYLGDSIEQLTDMKVAVQNFDCSRYSQQRDPSRVREQREIKYSSGLGVVIWERHSRLNRPTRERQVVAILSPSQSTMDAIADAVRGVQ
jgi:hypothetical protein